MSNCNNCSSNTLYIKKPTSQDSCHNLDGCGQGSKCRLSITDPVAFCTPGAKLGPRKNREKVREQIKDYILLKMGAPVLKIELDEQQLDAAVDYALMVFEDYAPREYFNYYVFRTVPGKSVYTLPPDVGLVRNVFYREQPNMAFNASSDIGGAIPIDYAYPSGNYSSFAGGLYDPNQPIYSRAGEWTLYKMYDTLFNTISSQIGGWEWVDGLCNIKLYPVPCKCNSVIVHYLQKRPDFKQVTQAMFDGAYAEALYTLGRIRSKYTGNLPGPSGGVQLDGASILQESKELKDKWEIDLINKFSDILPITLG